MLAVLHRGNGMLNVQWRIGEDPHGIDIGIKDQLPERRVGPGTAVGFHEPLAAIRPEIAHRRNDTVRVFVPLEGSAEATADNADPHFSR